MEGDDSWRLRRTISGTGLYLETQAAAADNGWQNLFTVHRLQYLPALGGGIIWEKAEIRREWKEQRESGESERTSSSACFSPHCFHFKCSKMQICQEAVTIALCVPKTAFSSGDSYSLKASRGKTQIQCLWSHAEKATNKKTPTQKPNYPGSASDNRCQRALNTGGIIYCRTWGFVLQATSRRLQQLMKEQFRSSETRGSVDWCLNGFRLNPFGF